ncbi:DUF1932 domain-containing protein [Arthrobacter alpinus]|uniref:DUF1932 domain-containing protein n=1 Tax=Arthrobacter alpinus TaxID=656366 RepID=UPI0009E88A66|nr:DUF1932 domain-containing protein [Arthrobacter alpinus]
MSEPLRVVLIGSGPALTPLAEALLAEGTAVTVIAPELKNTGAAVLGDIANDALVTADIVMTFDPPVASLKVARQVSPLLNPGAVYADFNPGTPDMKRRMAELFPDGSFAEGTFTVVPELRADVAGSGAPAVAELLTGVGVAVENTSEALGDAAAREILRGMLDKSLAAAVIDVLWAAESLGQKDWAYQQVLATFEASSAATATGYLNGTAQHLKRRQMEMMDVVETMRETGYDSTLVAAIETNYSRILHGKRVPFSKLK